MFPFFWHFTQLMTCMVVKGPAGGTRGERTKSEHYAFRRIMTMKK